MGMPGPQIGSVSLVIHIVVNIGVFLKKGTKKIIQKIFHPSRPSAK